MSEALEWFQSKNVYIVLYTCLHFFMFGLNAFDYGIKCIQISEGV